MPEIGVMIQQKARKKKNSVLVLMLEESETSQSNVY